MVNNEICDVIFNGGIESNLDNYDVCKYTFNKDGQWYVKDLVHNTEMAYSDDKYWVKGVGEGRRCVGKRKSGRKRTGDGR